MEVVEAIAAVNSVAKLVFNLGKAVHEIAEISKDSSGIAQRLQKDSITLLRLTKLIEGTQLSLTLRCPDGDTFPVIEFMKTSGALELLHGQCVELRKGQQDHQSTIDTYQRAITTDPSFRRRLLTTWKWKNTLVRKTTDLSTNLEGLKSSLQPMVQLVHLEVATRYLHNREVLPGIEQESKALSHDMNLERQKLRTLLAIPSPNAAHRLYITNKRVDTRRTKLQQLFTRMGQLKSNIQIVVGIIKAETEHYSDASHAQENFPEDDESHHEGQHLPPTKVVNEEKRIHMVKVNDRYCIRTDQLRDEGKGSLFLQPIQPTKYPTTRKEYTRSKPLHLPPSLPLHHHHRSSSQAQLKSPNQFSSS